MSDKVIDQAFFDARSKDNPDKVFENTKMASQEILKFF